MRKIAAFVLGFALASSFLACEPPLPSLVVANATDVSTLDPYAMFSRVEISMADHVIQTLTFLDRDMEVVPWLATAWRVLDDEVTWEIALREGVRFHNGEPFDAEAVAFSLDQVNQRNAEGKTLGGATVAVPAAEITQVEIVDDATVRITTARPKVLLPFYLSQIPMVAPGFYADASDEVRAEQMVGTGPYVVSERIRDSHITLTRNPDYWGETPITERITLGDPGTPVYRSEPHVARYRYTVDFIEDGMTVLDMGCGTGVAARAIARRPDFTGTVLGIDLGPFLVETATRLAGEGGLADRMA
ncbi:MAG: methyltransferase domain-containing protein [Bacteroidetes bacterium]|nr:methyltransferase domain-containing protein [Bacteroidota bacterium]